MLLVFGDCELDMERRELRRDGVAVHTRAKVFDVLSYLIANRDQVISRDELLTHGWPGLTVSDATLSSCILSVRRAIGDDVGDPRFIKTLRGQGFRFIGDVVQQGGAPVAAAGAPVAAAARARDDNPSIAILPFANLNNDSSLDYLADGLAEDITTELSRFKMFTVIARNSAFQYRGLASDIPKIRAELGVDYVLEGSVRCVGDAFRATAQLIHGPSNKHLWAEHFDGTLTDIFSLQDEITQRIVADICPEMALEEFRRAATPPAGNLRALAMAWQARSLMDRSRTEGDPALYAQGMQLAEEAVALDPQCRHAWWTVSLANYLLAFARAGDKPERFLKRAREAAEKLRALDRTDHRAYMSLGWISYIERDMDQALTYLQQAHEFNPNCPMTLTMMGLVSASTGRAQAGYDFIARATRVSPRDLWLGFMIAAQAFACYALDRFEEGAKLARRAIQREPNAPGNHIILAACLADLDDMKGAAAAAKGQRRVNEHHLQQYLNGDRVPFKDPALTARYMAAISRAAAAESA